MIRQGRTAALVASAVFGVGTTHGLGLGIDASPSGMRALAQEAPGQYLFARDSVLGTSMELIVRAPREADAIECERRVLAEIDRLCAILSTYDAASEISQVKQGSPIRSIELQQVINSYALWSGRSGGAIDLNMSEVIRLWKQSAAGGVLPEQSALTCALKHPLAWNVDALGKGFIVDCAVAVARQVAPEGLLNIGGDIRAWGDRSWKVGVTDPGNPAENAPVLTTFDLIESAAATSGGYARYLFIDGVRYSHVIDPRTGWPVDHITSATVIAPDCLSANALSTAAVVLGAPAGEDLLRKFGAGGHLIVDDAHGIFAGGAIPAPKPVQVAMVDEAVVAWPKDFQVSVDLALKNPAGGGGPGQQRGRGGGGFKRPYVAVWVHDANQKVVRTIAVWGNQARWLPELSYWWRAADQTPINVDTLARATRAPGKYTVAWDGKNDAGKAVPPGTYTITVEFNREHGRHVKETATIECKQEPQKVVLKATAESDESSISFGPRSP